MDLRPATKADIERWYRESGTPNPGFRMRAITCEHDGKLLGLAGIYYQQAGALPVVFSELLPEARKYKKHIVIAARRVMQIVIKRGHPVAALCTSEEGMALCKRLGFELMNKADKGMVMLWQPPQSR